MKIRAHGRILALRDVQFWLAIPFVLLLIVLSLPLAIVATLCDWEVKIGR